MRCIAAAFVLASLLPLGGCATYKQDLERAEKHYSENRFDSALALFRVLEPDMDSLSAGDQARYSYLRGMTDFRLAALAPPGSGVADPRRMFRINARHWLGVAAAMEKATPGSLTQDERQRMDEILGELNREVYGGAEALADEPSGDKKPGEGGAGAPGDAAPGGTGAPGGAAPGAPGGAAPGAPGGAAPGGQPPAAKAPGGQPQMGTMPAGPPK